MALRNVVTLTGGLILMFVTSLKLALLVLGAVVLIMVPLHPVRPLGAQAVAARARTASPTPARGPARRLNAVQTVQAFTQEKYEQRAFGAHGRSALSPSPSAALARAP